MIYLRPAYTPVIFSARATTSVGNAGSAISCKNPDECRREIERVIREYVTSRFGDSSTDSYKAMFEAFASPADEYMAESYWYRKTIEDFLYALSACPPSSLTSGPDCGNAAVQIVESFTKHWDPVAGDWVVADDRLRVTWSEFQEQLHLPPLPARDTAGEDDPAYLAVKAITHMSYENYLRAKESAERASESAERASPPIFTVSKESSQRFAERSESSGMLWAIPVGIAAVILYFVFR